MNETNDAELAAKGNLRDLFGDDDNSDSEDCDNTSGVNGGSLHSRNECSPVEETNGDSFHQIQIQNQNRNQLDRKQTRKRKASNTSRKESERSNLNDFTNNKETWNQKIGIFDNVLTKDECDELIAVHASHAHAGYIDHLEVTRVSDLVRGDNSLPLVLPLLWARYKIWERLEEFYPEASLEIFPEYTALSAWHTGSFLRMHYDSNKDYLLDRHYSALLYLNDTNDTDCHDQDSHHPSNYHRNGFSGGDLVFEIPSFAAATTPNNEQPPSGQSIKRIQPRAGRLVCFPSSSDYVHGVEEITKGTRFAITMWFTKHPSAMESLQSLRQTYLSHPRFHNRHPSDTITNNPMSILSLQQPWETLQQAEALHSRTIQRAGLPKRAPLDSNHKTTKTTNMRSILLKQQDLLQVIAICWWKKGLPLGDLVSSATPTTQLVEITLESLRTNQEEVATQNQVETINIDWQVMGDQGFWSIFDYWKEEYLPKRWRGLSSAMDRWMKCDGGLITSVRDEEME